MEENKKDSANPVLTFEGKKYYINELPQDTKESIKGSLGGSLLSPSVIAGKT